MENSKVFTDMEKIVKEQIILLLQSDPFHSFLLVHIEERMRLLRLLISIREEGESSSTLPSISSFLT